MDLLTTTFDSKKHVVSGFDCGNKILNDYIQKYASQNQKKNIAKTFVLLKDKAVMGYYTLSASSVQSEFIPGKYRKVLPNYPVPCVLLGKMAVDRSMQNSGVGSLLLADANKRVFFVSHSLAVYALVVDAKNSEVKKFYHKFGFLEFNECDYKMFLPISSVANWLS